MINKASINILGHKWFCGVIFSFLSVYEWEWDCWIYSMKDSYHFPLINCTLSCSIFSTKFGVDSHFNFSHSSGWIEILTAHCDFSFYFHMRMNTFEPFLCAYWAFICLPFLGVSSSIFCFYRVDCLYIVALNAFFVYLSCKPFIRYLYWIFFIISGLPLHFLTCLL